MLVRHVTKGVYECLDVDGFRPQYRSSTLVYALTALVTRYCGKPNSLNVRLVCRNKLGTRYCISSVLQGLRLDALLNQERICDALLCQLTLSFLSTLQLPVIPSTFLYIDFSPSTHGPFQHD